MLGLSHDWSRHSSAPPDRVVHTSFDTESMEDFDLIMKNPDRMKDLDRDATWVMRNFVGVLTAKLGDHLLWLSLFWSWFPRHLF